MSALTKVEAIRQLADALEEDYPDQRKQLLREKFVELAVNEAEGVIMEAADDAVVSADELTVEVMYAFAEKVLKAQRLRRLGKDLTARFGHHEEAERVDADRADEQAARNKNLERP